MLAVLKNLVCAGLLAATAAAHSAAPTFDLDGAIDVEYTGEMPMSQTGNQTVHWFLEQQNVSYATALGDVLVDSWMVFYNPLDGRQVFGGSIVFNQPIVEVFVTQQGLLDSASFGKTGTSYDYSARFIGLERGDRDETSFAGGAISIGKWASGEPGDYIRVLTVTAVPEPETYGLMLAGLVGLGCTLNRRKRT